MLERFHVLSNCLESKVVFWVTYSVELSRHVPFVAAIVVAHLEMRLFPGFLDPIAYQTLKLYPFEPPGSLQGCSDMSTVHPILAASKSIKNRKRCIHALRELQMEMTYEVRECKL